MNCPLSTLWRPLPPGRRGFSFVEILFAIMILGVGFIMVAAMFPVAIQQSQQTFSDATAGIILENASRYIETLGDSVNPPNTPASSLLPVTPMTSGVVQYDPLTTTVPAERTFDRIKGNRILSSDPRFAWVPLFLRFTAAPTTTVYLIAVQCRNQTSYINDPNDPTWVTGRFQNDRDLYPSSIRVTVTPDPAGVTDTITIVNTPAAARAAEGAFVVIADGTDTSGTSTAGTIYRLGAPRPDLGLNVWELAPGWDTRRQPAQPIPSGPPPVNAFIVGRGLHDPRNAPTGGNLYEGPAQDVAITTLTVN